MYLKEASALVIGIALSIHVTKAENPYTQKDTIGINRENNKSFKKSIETPSPTIDILPIKHENDLGNSHFNSLLAKRLSPLKLKMETTDNAYVQNYIKKFSAKNYQFHLSKMLGLSTYYFPIFEQAFKEVGVPHEIKYLTIIESALNPHAVSRVGATGPWQFMYATAKGYGLTMNSYIDERKDPYAASYAAANYLKDAFETYQDWFLAIASYNCGQGNVNRAIRRSGLDNPSFWQIKHLLPRETQNYVPAFIAMHHVLSNHEQYGIDVDKTTLGKKTEVIMVDRHVSLSSVAKALNIDENQINKLNPAYKRKVINGSKDNLQRLVVPVVDEASYGDLYYALQGDSQNEQAKVNLASTNPKKSTITHRIQKGESLEKIALKFKVTVQDLKAWNNLKTNVILPGQLLKINSVDHSIKLKPAQFVTHKVKNGDTLSAIANRYKINNISELKAMNNLKSTVLKPGMTLKIKEI